MNRSLLAACFDPQYCLLLNITEELQEECWVQVEKEIRFTQTTFKLNQPSSSNEEEGEFFVIPDHDAKSLTRAFCDVITGDRTQKRIQKKGKAFNLFDWWKCCVCSSEIHFVA